MTQRLDGLKIAKDIAKSRGGKCLSTEYKNNKTHLKWQCGKNHKSWFATLSNVKDNNSWCPECDDVSMRLDINIAHQIARNYGGVCLSTECKNNKVLLEWQCKYKHNIWKASLDKIKNKKTWCPHCKLGKTQNMIRNIVENTFQSSSISNYRPNWMKNPNTSRNLEIDIWLPELKLAIEYNGQQHYEPVWGEKEFGEIKERDKIKKRLIKNAIRNGIIKRFVLFTYKEKINENIVLSKINNT